jgi:hypothetical protein
VPSKTPEELYLEILKVRGEALAVKDTSLAILGALVSVWHSVNILQRERTPENNAKLEASQKEASQRIDEALKSIDSGAAS